MFGGIPIKKKVKSPGSATVINAIATGKGSAFGIKLYVTAEAKIINSGIKCSTKPKVDTKLMEICAKKVLERLGVKTGLKIKTESNLPVASGLSSSSAASNAVTLAVYELISEEFDTEKLDDMDIIELAIDSSLEAGVTITGAFDDATASFFGGLTITDNLRREIIYKGKMDEKKVVIYNPKKKSFTAEADVKRMKLISPWVDIAFKELLNKNIYKALTLNGILYSSALGFNTDIIFDALDAGALASGLSGTGPSFIAIVDNDKVDNVVDAWNSYPGEVILTEVDNEGTKVI